MIELYEGRLGGGKSYSAVVRMVDHLRRGGLVCTNVELVWSAICIYVAKHFRLVLEDDQLIKLSDEQIGHFHRHTPTGTPELPVLVVIDEAHLNFNARSWAETHKSFGETLTFLTQSRKVHTDVIFIAQSVLNMDKQFMRLVQYIWRFRDLTKYRLPVLGIAWPLKQILAVQYDYDGKTIMSRAFVKKDPKIFALYNTHSLLRAFPRLEGALTKRTLVKKQESKPMAKYMIVGVVLAIVLGIGVAAYKFKSGRAENTRQRSVPVAPAAAPHAVETKEIAEAATRKAQDEAYAIYDEHFQSWNEPERILTTEEGGWYQVAEMSTKGFVLAVSPRRAKVTTPDGRTAWVVAGKSKARPVVTPNPSATPRNTVTVVAPNSFVKTDSTPGGTPFANPLAATPTPITAPVYRNGHPVSVVPVPTPTP